MPNLPSDINIVRKIRSNHRYACYEVLCRGERAFAKVVASDIHRKGIIAEICGIRTFQELATMVELPFRIPQVLRWGEDHVVTSWAEGRLLGKVLSAADIDFFVRAYAEIDRTSVTRNPSPSRFTTGTTLERLQNELDKIAPHPNVDISLVRTALECVKAGLPSLEARLTHPDLTPDNVLVDDGIYTLIDYETVSMRWPRFYDVINCGYNRVIIGDEALAQQMRQMIVQFFESIGEPLEQHLRAVNTLCMLRAVSFVVEILGKDKTRHNTQEQMTREISERIETSIKLAVAGRPAFS